MTLSPEDIQSKQFHVRFRGFDVEEVDGFLEQVAENYLMLIEENRTLKTKIESMTQDLEVFKQDESSFKNAIVSAQKVVDEMKKKSRNDANRMLMQANTEVTQLKDEANREIAALEAKVDQLKGMEGRLITDLRSVLNDYLAQLDYQSTTVVPVATQPPPATEHKSNAPTKRQEDERPLYEKITLDEDDEDDTWLAQAEADMRTEDDDRADSRLSGPAIGGLDLEDEEPSVTIPDMDDDVMFTLDDPLDSDAGRRRR